MNHSASDSILFSLTPGLFMVLVGLIVKYLSTKYPNMWCGYRTGTSTQNEDTWKEGNAYSGILFIRIGIINIVVFAILGYLLQNTSYTFWDTKPKAMPIAMGLSLSVLGICCILSIILT